MLKGNGNAVAIGDISIDNDYYWTFGGASATEYGQALYNAKYMRLQFSYNSNYSNGLYKIKNPMISSTSQSSFISYVPNSPSPDYPSEVECVKGKNLFDYTKLNDENTVQWTAYENLGTMFRALPIYVGKNKQVYFSSNVPALTTGNASYAINNINERSSNSLNINNSRVISSNSDGYVYLGVETNRQYYTEVQSNKYWIMISTDNQPYLPYDTIQVKDLNSALKWANGTYFAENLSIASDFIKIEKGKSYISKYKMQIILFNKNKEYIGSYNNSTDVYNSFTISTDSTCNYVKIAFRSKNNNNVDFTTIEDIQLEVGTQATSYEPYQENTLNIDLQGNELCSLPDGIKDELVVKNGRVKIIKNVDKYNITGNEAWALSSTESQPYINFSNYVNDCKYPVMTTELPNLLSNYYLQITRNNLYDGRITLSPGKALIIYDTVHNTSLANFKEWLKSVSLLSISNTL